jgi:hypothetical protein
MMRREISHVAAKGSYQRSHVISGRGEAASQSLIWFAVTTKVDMLNVEDTYRAVQIEAVQEQGSVITQLYLCKS